MSDCPYWDKERSGALSQYCQLTGMSVEKDFEWAYCADGTQREHCPVLGGDNRVVNKEALTEEVCDEIVSCVTRNFMEGRDALAYWLETALEKAAALGYAYLVERMVGGASFWVEDVRLNGEYVDLVDTAVERTRAKGLERKLNDVFEGFQPAECFGRPACGSVLRVSEADFGEISATLSSAVEEVEKAFNGSISVIEKYQRPAEAMQKQAAAEATECLLGMRHGVHEARERFVQGCGRSLGALGAFGGSLGFGARWL